MFLEQVTETPSETINRLIRELSPPKPTPTQRAIARAIVGVRNDQTVLAAIQALLDALNDKRK